MHTVSRLFIRNVLISEDLMIGQLFYSPRGRPQTQTPAYACTILMINVSVDRLFHRRNVSIEILIIHMLSVYSELRVPGHSVYILDVVCLMFIQRAVISNESFEKSINAFHLSKCFCICEGYGQWQRFHLLTTTSGNFPHIRILDYWSVNLHSTFQIWTSVVFQMNVMKIVTDTRDKRGSRSICFAFR